MADANGDTKNAAVLPISSVKIQIRKGFFRKKLQYLFISFLFFSFLEKNLGENR
jgi:hypothetical protein